MTPEESNALVVWPPDQAAEARAAFLATVPDDELTREYMKRHNARRAQGGGRPKTLQTCPKGCEQQFGARELRIHLPTCTGKPKPKLVKKPKTTKRKKGGR
jgi:hypothetical protein